MHWIIQFIIQHKNISSLALTISCSLWLLSINATKQHAICRGLSVSIFFPVQFTVNQLTRIRTVFTDTRKLNQQIAHLQMQLALMEDASTENKRLRELLNIKERFASNLLPAQVIVREPKQFFNSIIINVGKMDGVLQYMPVVHKDGVIGKVVQVLAHTSLVQLYRNPAERISVMDKRNNEVGIVETNDGRTFFIQYRKHCDILVGDTIVTSGLGGIYPRGIHVGVITKIKDEKDPIFKTATFEPLVNFEHIDEIFVVLLSPQWAAFRSELDSIKIKP